MIYLGLFARITNWLAISGQGTGRARVHYESPPGAGR
jgi:hypothetical protein